MTVAASADSVSHLVQVALAPIFLLAGVATRLGRVADRVDSLAAQSTTTEPERRAALDDQLAYLRRRSLVLDCVVVLAAVAGAATCGAALTLFVGALRNRAASWALFSMFGFAMLARSGRCAPSATRCCSPAAGYAPRH